MIKVIVLLQKRADLSREQFTQHWREVHGPIAQRLPGLRRYVQNHLAGDNAAADGVAELWFDSSDDMQAAFGSDVGKETVLDGANFLSGQQVMVAEEVEMAPMG
jgi:uncharacterized protein (TIGR02118 family)